MGGASGHLQHPAEDLSLKFSDLKRMLTAAARAELKEVTEKTDGQNIMITWNESEHQVKAARNTSDLRSGGMTAGDIAAKFAGRGAVEEAFKNGFAILNKAISSLPENARVGVFGENGNTWVSVEIMYTKLPNTVQYDKNSLVFHRQQMKVVDDAGNQVSDPNAKKRVDLLVKHIENMQAAVANQAWTLSGPGIVALKRLDDGTVLDTALTKIDAIMKMGDASDGDTLGQYAANRLVRSMKAHDLALDKKGKENLAKRILGIQGAPTIAQITKGVSDSSRKKYIKQFAAEAKATAVPKIMRPIELTIHEFAVEVLKGLHSVFMLDSDAEVVRQRAKVQKAIDAIEASGHEGAMGVLSKQMEKLRSADHISTAMEGIVFTWKGQAYKFTGSFAPVHQILSMFSFGYKGEKIPELSLENHKRDEAKDRAVKVLRRIAKLPPLF